MFNKLIIYNNFHNGDVHYSREIAKIYRDFIPSKQVIYAHLNHPKILKDLNIDYMTTHLDKELFVFDDNNNLYINTWIGTNARKYLVNGEVTCKNNLLMYNDVKDILSNRYGVVLPDRSLRDFVPSIDFTRFNTSPINSFFEINKKKTVFYVNSKVLSGQSPNINHDIIIEYIASNNPDINFIVTNKTNIVKENVFYANEINQVQDGCDLIENGYISTLCDIIIGQGSGSFCFAGIKENYLSDKLIIGIGYSKNTVMWYDTLNNICFNDNEVEILKENIHNAIKG